MLHFKARPRKSPTLDAELTNSERRVMRMFREAMEKTRNIVIAREGQILDALLHRPADAVVDLVPVDPYLDIQPELEAELLAELQSGGRRVTLPTIEKAVVSFRFDAARPEASAWAKKEAGKMIRDATQEQLDVVREYVSRGALGDFTPQQIARGLRDTIGLTSQQAGWVENFRDREIKRLEDTGMSRDRAVRESEKATQRYHDRIHRYRTETIARTEVLSASHEGRRQAWQQGLEEGFISPYAKKEWSTEIDGRECSTCGPLDGTQAMITGDFPGGDPPIHPNCRCDVLLIPEDIDPDVAALSDDDLDTLIDDLLENPPVAPPETYLSPDEGASFEDIRGSADNILARADSDYTGDPVLREIYRERGYDGRPQIVTAAELDRLAAEGAPILYRGVTQDPFVEEFRRGEYFAGRGVFGSGTYSSTSPNTALRFANDDPNRVVRFTMAPGSRVIDQEDLFKEMSAYRRERDAFFRQRVDEIDTLISTAPTEQVAEELRATREGVLEVKAAQDEVLKGSGRFAASRGYDAIRVTGVDDDGEEYVIGLNRSRMVLQDTNGISDA